MYIYIFMLCIYKDICIYIYIFLFRFVAFRLQLVRGSLGCSLFGSRWFHFELEQVTVPCPGV